MMFIPPMMLAAGSEVGGHLSIVKIVPLVILLLGWARLLTWADKDAIAAHLPREWLNTGLFGGAMLSCLLFFFMPGTLIAYIVVAFVFLASVGTYLLMRHQKVGLADLKKEIKKIGGAKKKKDQAPTAAVQFSNKKGNVLSAPPEEDPARAGFDAVQEFVTAPLRRFAEKIEVRPTEPAATIQYTVDGVGYSAPAMDRAKAAAGITWLKAGAGMDVEDRRKPQTANLRAMIDGKRHDVEITTAGSTAGESMRIVVDPKKRFELALDALGLAPEQLTAVTNSIGQANGSVIITAPRQQGLTSMLYAVLRKHDAFLSHIQTIEHGPKADLEGITQNNLAPNATPAEEAKLVEWIISQQPDVIMMDEMANPVSAKLLAQFALEKRAYIAMRYGSTFDALAAWRKTVGDDELALRSVSLIITGRILRKLCMACKVAYQPDPDTLKKLNMDPARVTKLFQARTQPMVDQKGNPIACQFCQELHYKGRFGIFEVLVIDDEIRQALLAGGSPNQLKQLFRKQRGRYLQEMALAQVEAGETSVQEVLRVLRGAEQQAQPAARPAAQKQAR